MINPTPRAPTHLSGLQMLTCCVVKRLLRLSVLAQVESLIFSNQLFDLIHLSVARWDFQSGTGDKYMAENSGNAVRHTASFAVLWILTCQVPSESNAPFLSLTFGPLLSSRETPCRTLLFLHLPMFVSFCLVARFWKGEICCPNPPQTVKSVISL